MAAGRPRGFCTDKALDSAMQVFWRKGYEGASMVDLTTAIGINSPSLYAAFGSKEGLFRAVLERYDARRAAFLESLLAAPTAHKVAELFLHGVADFAADTGGKIRPVACCCKAACPAAIPASPTYWRVTGPKRKRRLVYASNALCGT